MPKLAEIGGRRIPLLRWSFLRMALGMKHLTTHWQVGDGREEALAEYVIANARAGDLDDAIRAVDEFCYSESFMINVGDEKGEILDAAIRRAEPRRLLELGTYCGYSALRTARVMPDGAHLVLDRVHRRRTPRSPGGSSTTPALADRVTVVVGTLGDGGQTIARAGGRARLRRGLARLRLPRPRQGRVPARPRADRRARLAAARRGRRGRQRQVPGRARPTASTCESTRAATGGPPSTRRTSSTRR